MAYRKKYRKRHYKKRRGRRISVKSVRRIVRKTMANQTDFKKSVQQIVAYPEDPAYHTYGWRPLDPPFSFGSIQTLNQYDIPAAYCWGWEAQPFSYIDPGYPLAPFFQGTTLKRISFSLQGRIKAGCFSGNAIPFTLANPPKSYTELNPVSQSTRLRISVIRAVNTVTDQDLLSQYLPRWMSDTTNFERKWDKKVVQVLKDRIFTFNWVSKNEQGFKFTFRGKLGAQKLRIPQDPETGELEYPWIQARQPMIVYQTEAWYDFVEAGTQYQYIPYIDRLFVQSYYVDI